MYHYYYCCLVIYIHIYISEAEVSQSTGQSRLSIASKGSQLTHRLLLTAGVIDQNVFCMILRETRTFPKDTVVFMLSVDFKVMYSMDALLKSVCYRWFVCLLRCWQQCFQQMLAPLHSLCPPANPSIILFYNWDCVIFFLLFIFWGLVSIIACCWQPHANTLCRSWLLPRMGLSKLCYSLAMSHTFFSLFFVGPKKINFLVVLLHASCGVYLFPLLFFIFFGGECNIDLFYLPPQVDGVLSLSGDIWSTDARGDSKGAQCWPRHLGLKQQQTLMHTSMHYIRKNSVASHGLLYTTPKIKGTLKSHAVSRWVKYSNWKSLWHTHCVICWEQNNGTAFWRLDSKWQQKSML